MASTVLSRRVVRFGIAGVGAASREAQAILRHPHLSLTAVADRDPEALARFQAQYGVAGHGSVEELCQRADVDAIFIGTPTDYHAEHALMALEQRKHAIVAKPMALTLEDAERMVAAAERNGVFLMVGHSQAFEPPIRKIRELVASGELGPLRMIHSWYFTDWIYRGRLPAELDTRQGGGVVYRQGAHQFDIIRLIGGGLVRSVRASAGVWDAERPTEGAYAAFLDFEDGAVATAVFSGYDHFHSTELGFGIGEGGQRVVHESYAAARRALREAGPAGEAALKRQRRSGAGRARSADTERWHAFYGLTIVSCERGDIRQSPAGLLVYGDEEVREVPLPGGMDGRDVMVNDLYEAIIADRPPLHSGRWGKATLEVQLAVLESSRQRREVILQHQVAADPTPRSWSAE